MNSDKYSTSVPSQRKAEELKLSDCKYTDHTIFHNSAFRISLYHLDDPLILDLFVILSIMVDRFSSRIYNPKLIPVKMNSIVVS